MTEPTSRLTMLRPDIWTRGLALATALTGYRYVDKLPLADGTIYACGGGMTYLPPRPTPPVKQPMPPPAVPIPPPAVEAPPVEEKKVDLPDDYIPPEKRVRIYVPDDDPEDGETEEEKKKKKKMLMAPVVVVPEGALEWLLHEVGHWIAADDKERGRHNYGLTESEQGHDGDREWQVWAFEEIVLAPFGPARLFAPPTQRDGAAFAKAGPMPRNVLCHVERRIRDLGLDIEPWRLVWADWIRFERSMRCPSWAATPHQSKDEGTKR